MIALRTAVSMRRAAESHADPSLRALLALRIRQLSQGHNFDLSEVVEFLIVEPGDAQDVIEAEAGFPILSNIVDGTRFGDPDFSPCFEALLDHGPGRWFELVYLFTDDGYGSIVLVPDDPGVEFDVHSLCLQYAGRVECA